MRPADPPPPVADAAYLAQVVALAAPFGITHTGVAAADVLGRARSAIEQRLADDLVDGMQFTFKNPARSTDPQQAVRGAQSIIVAARPYLLDEPAPPPGPVARVARYAWADHYGPLREGLWAMAHRLRADGYKAVAYADDNSIVDREVAHRAGLGWFGKNANVLLPGAGSWFVLGCVVTTAAFEPAAAPVADGCGSCVRCIDACPTGAIVAPGVIDARRCLAWVLQKPGLIPREMRAAIGDRIYGCDDCQTSCPPTVRLGRRVPAPSLAAPPTAWLPVLMLLTANDDEVMAAWGRWYLADRDPRWVRRNALVVLGNVGNGTDAAVRAVLADYLAHDDPVLRAHAVWAAHRLGALDLMPATDPHPDVLAELAAAR
ncbi:MAG: tRNA epoxyqueuosine(34) reductase QueG [Ilumatobacteraceae bacterium]